jgi:hypothetical protein
MTDLDTGDLIEVLEQSGPPVESTSSEDIGTRIVEEFCANIEETEEVDEAVVDAIDQLISDDSLDDSDMIVTEIISAVE